MGLLPLEFTDCLQDSPYFRENLKAHEKQLDQTSTDIKAIIKDIQDVLDAAKILSKAKRTLAHSLSSFQFDCLGTSLTDDEVIISKDDQCWWSEYQTKISKKQTQTDHKKYPKSRL